MQSSRTIYMGTIVGRYMLTGILMYETRQQGSQFYAETESELMEIATALKHEKVAECGQAAQTIYPADSWSMRIIG